MKDLLVCVPHHHQPDRLPYLLRVLETFAEYELACDVIVDTNVAGLAVKGDNVSTVHHASMAHPFHLTWFHRQHIRSEIENYRWYAYIEDDLLLPFTHFERYRENFEMVWPNAVPAFLRIEAMNGVNFAVDVTVKQSCVPVVIQDRTFCTLAQPYHAAWILPQKALRESLRQDFVRLSDSRETAASFPSWELGKTPLVQIELSTPLDPEVSKPRYQIHPECWAFHVPNNYSREPESPHGKIPVKEIFVK